jgi:hypothetical protein
MAVSLTISETLNGTQLSDALSGGGTGLDLGSCANGSFAPVSDKVNNIGRQDIFIRHNAVTDPITSVKFYVGQYGVLTGFTYGGQRTAADDFSALVALGNASGSSKNNADGLSGGLWIDQRWNASDATQFDKATYPTKVFIFGDSGTDGVDLASAFGLITDASVYNNAGTEVAATTPVAGKIGKSGDSVLGDRAHLRMRIYLPTAQTEGGIYQFEFVTAYTYTA